MHGYGRVGTRLCVYIQILKVRACTAHVHALVICFRARMHVYRMRVHVGDSYHVHVAEVLETKALVGAAR